MLEQGGDLEENGSHERILPILGDLSMKDPNPTRQLLSQGTTPAYDASIPIVKALRPFLLL